MVAYNLPNYGQPQTPYAVGTPVTQSPAALPAVAPPAITPAAAPNLAQSNPGYAGTGTEMDPITQGLGLRHVNADGSMGGLNWGTVGSIGQIGSSLMTAWNAWQQNKIARETLDFQKDAYNTNLDNTIQSYNTALEDRIGARYAAQGRSDQAAQRHIQREQLSR